MQKGGWLSAKEALAWGFVDELTDFEEDNAPEITDAIAADFKAHNIPIPNIPTSSHSRSLPAPAAESKEELTAFRRFLLSLSKAFHAQSDNDTNPPTYVKKEFKTICQLLKQDSIETSENSSLLTAEQLDTLEAEFQARETMVASLTEKVNQLAEKNKSLEAKLASLPADTTQSVVDNNKHTNPNAELSDIERFIAAGNSAQALFNALP